MLCGTRWSCYLRAMERLWISALCVVLAANMACASRKEQVDEAPGLAEVSRSGPPPTQASSPASAAVGPETGDVDVDQLLAAGSEPEPEHSGPARSGELDVWKFGRKAKQPLARLYFGMDFEEAWTRAPELRSAMTANYESQTYDEVRSRIPELGEGSEWGNHWNSYKSRQSEGLTLVGAEWELNFDVYAGLNMIFAIYPDEDSLHAAIASWGEPDVDARWKFWFDEASGTRAAVSDSCQLEFAPYQSVESFLAQLFPGGKTLIGRSENSLGRGELVGSDERRYALVPLPTSLWMLAEFRFDESTRRVTWYRAPMSFTYDANAEQSYRDSLRKVVLDLAPGDDGCQHGSVDGQPVSVCSNGSQLAVSVGRR
jgi:hypothetical protein